MTAPDSAAVPPPIWGVAFEAAHNLIEICFDAAVAGDTADLITAGAARGLELARPGAHLLIDARRASFPSAAAPPVLSSGSWWPSDLESVSEVALWVAPEHVEVCAHDRAFTDPRRAPAPPWVSDRLEISRRSVHLVAGSTGAGKSTYAMRLADDIGGMHLAIDDWMQRLFGPDRPADADFAWYIDRIERCEAQMWQLACDLHRSRAPAVLDLGLTTREHRRRFLARADRARIPARLHYVDVDPDRRWQRVLERNRDRGATFRLEVTREMFDFMESRFEPPTADEHTDFIHRWS